MQHAKAALAAGADSLVAQGNEAGGHTGHEAKLRLDAQIPLPDRF
jgi:NAD(P)H-dependent flavin oxidoreductase YrpB (nitropropane dioxygenase family)